MTRIARWFGFGPGGEPREQQLTAGSQAHEQYKSAPGKQPYLYPQPQLQQQQLQQGGKAPCTNCNKFPWVPMLPPNIQYTLTQQYQQQEQQQEKQKQNQQQQQWAQSQQHQHYLQSQATQQQYLQKQQIPIFQPIKQQQQTPVKQRAVQFNFPTLHNQLQQYGSNSYHRPPALSAATLLGKLPLSPPQYPAAPFIPIPVPNLSASALPPLYNAQPFRPIVPSTAATEQQLPSTEQAHFNENIGAHSELQPDSVYPTQIPPTTNAAQDSSFEIVKSHQLTDFVTSVEYPTTFVQSQSFDIAQEPLPVNHKDETVQANTVRYQHETLDPKLSDSHIPGSQLLTQLSSFGGTTYKEQKQDGTLTATSQYEQTTLLYPQTQQDQKHQQSQQSQQFVSHSLVADNGNNRNEIYYDSGANDNYPSASSHNFSAVEHANQADLLPNWATDIYSAIQTDESFYSTPQPATNDEISTDGSEQLGTDYITERIQDTTVEFLPSLQTDFTQQQHIYAQQQAKKHKTQQRETPKRLLDAPIAHAYGNQNSPPRPFTRDPSELNYRLGAISKQPHEFQHANHAYTAEFHQSTSAWTQPTAAPVQVVSTPAPTPTSTYGAIDASGHYAGMSPPVPPHQQLHQIVIPYTTKNRPRPFKPNLLANPTIPHKHYDSWPQSNDVDPHVQEESKLVNTATNAPVNSPRTTKYLTRILASNLRDLLKREHEVKNKSKSSSGFDFSKLQQNIDDWTEQEFTSLSHRPSTPTIRGRSKHIPNEYLTTTPATARKPKTTKAFDVAELSSSINSLEPLLVDRGSKRFQYEPIEDNRIADYIEPFLAHRRTSTSTSLSTTTSRPYTATASTTTTAVTPFYIRAVTTTEPAEVWQKAKVSISPQTKERVYVVTPQPRFFPQSLLATTTTETTLVQHKEGENDNSFKSPRFLVRPTPRDGSLTTTPSPFYAPELFGLMGLSAYIPSEPVEIIDGNSKVNTIVTPSSKVRVEASRRMDTADTLLKPSKVTSRPTMSPSPR